MQSFPKIPVTQHWSELSMASHLRFPRRRTSSLLIQTPRITRAVHHARHCIHQRRVHRALHRVHPSERLKSILLPSFRMPFPATNTPHPSTNFQLFHIQIFACSKRLKIARRVVQGCLGLAETRGPFACSPIRGWYPG